MNGTFHGGQLFHHRNKTLDYKGNSTQSHHDSDPPQIQRKAQDFCSLAFKSSSSLTASAANLRMPSDNLSVAISSSFNMKRNVFSSSTIFSRSDFMAAKKQCDKMSYQDKTNGALLTSFLVESNLNLLI